MEFTGVGYLSDARAEASAEVFERDPRVQVAYLFGSSCTGRRLPESDTDVAVLLSDLPGDMLECYLDLVQMLSGPFGDELDLVILNQAPPLLAYQVVKEGRVIYCRDEGARIEFEAKTMRRYMDMSRARERYDRALVEEVSGWRP